MSIIDLVNDFQLQIEHTGDNETDSNTMIVRRDAVDANGHDINVMELYELKRYAVKDLLDNLEYAVNKLKKYIDE